MFSGTISIWCVRSKTAANSACVCVSVCDVWCITHTYKVDRVTEFNAILQSVYILLRALDII